MQGKLYLCATPIGNLEDITFRVIHTLKEVDLIAAEDTRHSIRLLNHFEIKTPMTSYHEFNKIDKAKFLVKELQSGKNIALITDAGMPAISDPGEELVRFCHEEGIEVTALPGASACVTALALSGLDTRRFCFEGFLPNDKKEQRLILERYKTETRTTIFYEAPHRLTRTLKTLLSAAGDRQMTICREITKKYETIMPTSVEKALGFYSENEPKGEFVLVIEGASQRKIDEEKQKIWEEMTMQDHLQIYLNQNMSKKEAMKAVATDRGISKRDVYQQLLE